MQRLAAFALILVTGCASTVTRLDGEYATPVGRAKNDCEETQWLVVSPTRAEIVEEGHKKPTTRDDGAGLYKVGEKFPESITGLQDDLGRYSPTFDTHAEHVQDYDTKRIIAGSLGAAGVIAIAVGTALFISAFGDETRHPDGTVTGGEINSGRAVTGSITVGIGLGLGIAGIAVNPKHAERSRADAWRYVFLPPDDSREDVVDLAAKHNQAVRDRCEAAPATAR